MPSPGRFHLPCTTPRKLIQIAYGTFNGSDVAAGKMDVIGGPSWVDKEQYEVNAVAPNRPSVTAMAGPMLQRLLEDRFALRTHVEAKEQPVYALSVVASGAKLRPSHAGSCAAVDLDKFDRGAELSGNLVRYCGFGQFKRDGTKVLMELFGNTMAEFAARWLAHYVDRPVVDRTGLAGRFGFQLEFSPNPAPGGIAYLNGVPTPVVPEVSPNDAESIYSAIRRQLGLQLKADRAPIDTVIIDHIEHPSSDQ